MKRPLIVVMAIVMCASLAACGDDGGNDGPVEKAAPAKPLSKKRFLAQANKICATGNAKIEAASRELGPGRPSKKEFQGFIRLITKNVQGQINKLRKLNPPVKLGADFRQLLREAQLALDRVKDKGIALFQSERDPFADVNAYARELGLKECAE